MRLLFWVWHLRSRSESSGFSLIEVMAALCLLLAASMLSFSAGSASWGALRAARLEAEGLAAGRDKIEELIALVPALRLSGQDQWRQGASDFTRIWRVRPWVGHPGLQRLEVSTRWSDEGLVILDLVAVAR
jgi:prepilin-type N-terminal cleavage/methylation domain-containing protein